MREVTTGWSAGSGARLHPCGPGRPRGRDGVVSIMDERENHHDSYHEVGRYHADHHGKEDHGGP